MLQNVTSTGKSVKEREEERAAVRRRRREWIGQALGPDAIRNSAAEGNDPAARYAAPGDVLRDSALSEAEKRSVLQHWALNAYLVESALGRGDNARPSRLDEVIDALIDLDEAEVRRIAAHAPHAAVREMRKAG
ncbi:MAG TPA: hypothetical protein VKT99_20370 [Xanthobacteraceae bacterium]|jgi:hypothetical protein|nr:hypothetical protein [Xanthobacteraceae bacterium]